jgi:hypothetical protein
MVADIIKDAIKLTSAFVVFLSGYGYLHYENNKKLNYAMGPKNMLANQYSHAVGK